MEYWSDGVMEYWSSGICDKEKNNAKEGQCN